MSKILSTNLYSYSFFAELPFYLQHYKIARDSLPDKDSERPGIGSSLFYHSGSDALKYDGNDKDSLSDSSCHVSRGKFSGLVMN